MYDDSKNSSSSTFKLIKGHSADSSNSNTMKQKFVSVSEHSPSSLRKTKGKLSLSQQRPSNGGKLNNNNNSSSHHSNSSNTHLRPSRQRRLRYAGGSSSGSLHDPSSHRIKVTRRTTNFVFFLLGLVPSMLLFFGHNVTLSSSPSGGTDSHIMEHHKFMKQQFQQDLNSNKKNGRPDPYSPALLTSDQIQANDSNHTVLHFVKSRFMQYQPNLTALGWARLELFREFCLPSVKKQTTQNFVWLIYTDPDLSPALLHAMVDLLAGYDNYYLIKTLSNEMWRGGQGVNLTRATVFTGNQSKLEAYIALRDTLPVLETRLDADDALNIEYLELVQQQAIPMFTQQGVEWMYWCVGQELEWNWVGPAGYNTDQQEYGVMESKPYEDFCPTPGLTLGYAANTAVGSIYSRRHSVLVERLHTKNFDFCGKGRQGKDCYHIVRNFEYPAFRCRTPTSASMVMTDFSKDKIKLKKIAKQGFDTRWDALRDSFGVPRSNVHSANNYMTKHILEIAEDALMGQCTKGHSCSVSDPPRKF